METSDGDQQNYYGQSIHSVIILSPLSLCLIFSLSFVPQYISTTLCHIKGPLHNQCGRAKQQLLSTLCIREIL